MAQTTDISFEQLDGESAQAFAAFRAYRDLGSERSHDNAWLKVRPQQSRAKTAPGHWGEWAGKFSWLRRARAYDQHLDRMEIEARERAVLEDAERWVKRRGLLLELEWHTGVELLKKAREKAKAGQLTNVAATAEIGSKLARRAARMPAEIESAPPTDWNAVMFESQGKLAASVPAGSVPEMPADVLGRPRVAIDEAIGDELPGGRRARQPRLPRPA